MQHKSKIILFTCIMLLGSATGILLAGTTPPDQVTTLSAQAGAQIELSWIAPGVMTESFEGAGIFESPSLSLLMFCNSWNFVN